MSLKTILEKALPFLFSKLTIIWDDLSGAEKDEMIQSGQIGQILKEEISNGEAAVVSAISAKTGLTTGEVNTTLLALAKAMGFDVSTVGEFIDQLQAKINAGLQDSEWDELWSTVSGTLMSLASGNPVNWFGLIVGIGKFVYDKFIKHTPAATDNVIAGPTLEAPAGPTDVEVKTAEAAEPLDGE